MNRYVFVSFLLKNGFFRVERNSYANDSGWNITLDKQKDDVYEISLADSQGNDFHCFNFLEMLGALVWGGVVVNIKL